MRYAVGNPAQNAAGAGEPIAVLWNPAGNLTQLRVTKIEVTGGTALKVSIARTTTQGTRGAVSTPDTDNSFLRDGSPASGVTADRGNYSATPTRETPDLFAGQMSGQNGTTIGWWFEEPILVPAGTGLGVWTNTTSTAQSACFEWEE